MYVVFDPFRPGLPKVSQARSRRIAESSSIIEGGLNIVLGPSPVGPYRLNLTTLL